LAHTTAIECIGWPSYLLTRPGDPRLHKRILTSGLTWGLSQLQLMLGSAFLVGSPPFLTALLLVIMATAFNFVFARLRLETGSVWPAITLHSAWNAIIQTAFDPASHGAQPELWIGESGILTALTMIVAAIAFSYGRWTILRTPE